MAFTAGGERLTVFFLFFLWNCHSFPRAFAQDPSPSEGTAAAFSLGLDLRLAYTPRHFNSRVFRHASVGYHATAGKGRWALAASKDWRAYGVVTPVREQGTCAASWAMASLASVESAWAITDSSSSSSDGSSESTPSTPIPLSVQQVLSCKGTLNCAGGLPSAALDYAASRTVADGGVYAESDWPYAGEHDTRCRHPPSGEPNQGTTAMFEQVPEFFGWFGLLLALQRQPVVVGVMGSYPSFQKFTGSDVYSDRSCTGGVVDHAVLVVGYVLPSSSSSSSSSSSEEPHWIIRNSWGTAWGDNGDMRMAMVGGNGICEIHSTPPLYPVVASGSPCSSGINPCGGGECVPAPGGDGPQYSCNCPDDFAPITDIDGSQSCTPVHVCSLYAANPCGVGVCIEDGGGGYGCVCPSGWTPAEYAAESAAGAAGGAQRSRTCVRDIEQSSTYVVEFESVTCEAVASAFDLSVTQLEEQNPTELASHEYEYEDSTICSEGESIPVGTTLNVTSDSDAPCAVRMSWGEDDDCTSVAKRAEISRERLTQLNAWLDCDVTPPAGFQVCISTTKGYWNIPVDERQNQQQVCTELLALGTPPDSLDSPPSLVEARPGVGYKAGASSRDSTQSCGGGGGGSGEDDAKPLPPAEERDLCHEVQAAKNLTTAELFALNPGIYCRNLAPTVVATGPDGEDAFGLVTSPPVCVAGDIVLLRKCPAVYRARERETCEGITARFFARSPSVLAAHNMGWRCVNCALYVGRPLCVPAPKPLPATCKKAC